ncbi:MAG: AraC family transcriptional regulator [Ruminiclostridium sp.]|nr:AraC family transcriptional regulator [Ruminiclostridium sp.]
MNVPAKINQWMYPYTEQVKNYPIFLTGIGGTQYQGHTKRPEGYYWHQILYCGSGNGLLKYDDVTVNITKGSFFFLPAYYPHEYFSEDDKWEVCWVVFDGYDCNRILSEMKLTKPVVITPDDSAALNKLFDKMFITLKSDKVFGNYTCSGLVYQYLIEFHRLVSNNDTVGGTDRSNILMPALNYIEENFRKDFSVAVLAEITGISQQYLCRIFKQTMNIRPNEYITCRRLQEAKRLLTETDIPIQEICIKSGFSDAGYFSTVFRKYENISPVEYRRKNNADINL